jgi:hypothetical protein
MNVILKDKYQYSSVTANGGGTSKGDGASYGLSFNSGANFAGKGFLNYTVALSQQDNAVRSGIIDVPTEIATFGGDQATDNAIRAYLQKYPTANNENGTGATTGATVCSTATQLMYLKKLSVMPITVRPTGGLMRVCCIRRSRVRQIIPVHPMVPPAPSCRMIS